VGRPEHELATLPCQFGVREKMIAHVSTGGYLHKAVKYKAAVVD
jgi:hypothetical protein